MSASLQRSELAVPATAQRFIDKSAACDADAIFLDLEDAVPPARKVEARATAIAALNAIDWGRKLVSVRVNALDTQWGFRDVLALAEGCQRLDRILLPKCDSPAHIRAVELLLTGLEAGRPRARELAIEALIETAQGLANVEAIAATRGRLRALIFGAGDFALDMKISERSVGTPSPDYVVLADGEPRQRHWNDPWHFALARVATACRANGLAPIDGPFTNLEDVAGYHAAAARARALGYEGKWAIHPSQIAPANEAFSPSPAQIAWANDVLALLAEAGARGLGAARTADGHMVDVAHGKMAHVILERADAVANAGAAS